MFLKRSLSKERMTTIFINAPDRKILYKRLKRRDEHAASIQKRVTLAKKELQSIKDYDYLIINQNFNKALYLLECILTAERVRRS